MSGGTNMSAASAFTPANISLIFETYPAAPPHGRGSLGVGITLTEGVTATVRRAAGQDTVIRVAGEIWEFPTVRTALSRITEVPLEVEITADFPFGCGFGMSGASALSAVTAADELLGLGLPRVALGMAAHDAEVANATGLGDVGGQYNGGIMMKLHKYQPLKVQRLEIPPQPLHYRIYGPILTASVINSPERLADINAAGKAALNTLAAWTPAETSLRGLFALSRTFAQDSRLMTSPRVLESVAAARAAGHEATMIMLGEAVVSTGPFPGSTEAEIFLPGGAEEMSGTK